MALVGGAGTYGVRHAAEPERIGIHGGRRGSSAPEARALAGEGPEQERESPRRCIEAAHPVLQPPVPRPCAADSATHAHGVAKDSHTKLHKIDLIIIPVTQYCSRTQLRHMRATARVRTLQPQVLGSVLAAPPAPWRSVVCEVYF